MPSEKAPARYRQIAAHLREGILDGTYPVGQPLPSEEVLAKQYGVSRPTVRQGIAELRAAGLVDVMMGRGMFVRSPRPPQPHPPERHPPRQRRPLHRSRRHPVDQRRRPRSHPHRRPLALAELLRIPPGEPLYAYDTLRTADHGRLRQLHRTYIPFSTLTNTKYEHQPPPPAPHLYTALADLGHQLTFTEHIRTRMPLPDQTQALRLPDGVPLLHILRVPQAKTGRPLVLEELHVPGDDLELTFRL